MQGRLRAGIDLLTAVAEEVETHLGGKQRQAASGALAGQSDEVLATLGVALPQSLRTAGEFGASESGHGLEFTRISDVSVAADLSHLQVTAECDLLCLWVVTQPSSNTITRKRSTILACISHLPDILKPVP